MYVRKHVRIHSCTYIYAYMQNLRCFSLPVASSVINATPMPVCTPAVNELYNITVTCTIHPESTADQCVVMAKADGRVNRTGEIHKISCVIISKV